MALRNVTIVATVGWLLLISCAGEVLDPSAQAFSPDERGGSGGDGSGGDGPGDDGSSGPSTPEPPGPSGAGHCDDGIDNDGDGLVDYGFDLGCAGPDDQDEWAGDLADEGGWTTFDPPASGRIFYVSPSGDDRSDGRDPARPLKTVAKGLEKLRAQRGGAWLLLERGATFENETLDIDEVFGGGPEDRVVISGYGRRLERPRIRNAPLKSTGELEHVAIVGIEFDAANRNPESPRFDGRGSGGTGSIIGRAVDLLLEGNLFEWGQITIQATGGRRMRDVSLRRNVVHHAWSATGHAQGLFSKDVDNLLVEENVFDHNGWLVEQQPGGGDSDKLGGQATLFNHNMYVTASDVATFRRNFVLRGSSIGIKFKANQPGDFRELLVEENVVYDGEVGMSIGGNTDNALRFVDTTLRRNVLMHIGKTGPTNRGLAFGLSIHDHDRTEIVGNLFLHQQYENNSYAIRLHSGTMRDVTVRENLFYGVRGRILDVEAQPAWSGVEILDNTFFSPNGRARMVEHEGPVSGITYSGNAYASTRPENEWFRIGDENMGLGGWATAAGEIAAQTDVPASFPDPDRDLASYDASLGGDGTFESFLARLMAKSPWNWPDELSAEAVVAYLEAGFGLP